MTDHGPGPAERLPLLSDQADRVAIQAWTVQVGLGEESRSLVRAFRLRGRLDLEALRQALAELVRRHDALRAAFPEHGRLGYQLIFPPVAPELDVDDLRDLPAAQREPEATARLVSALTPNLDLEAGLLFRARAARTGDDEHLFGLTIDHLVTDGPSLEILVSELWELYDAAVSGREADLPEKTFRYEDLLRWEQSWLAEDEEPRRLLAAWAERLDGLGPNPGLLLRGAKRATNHSYDAGVAEGSLPQPACRALPAYCRQRRTTPFVVVLAALFCALHHHSGEHDIGVMIPVTRRTEEHLQELVGFLSSYATVRAHVQPAGSFDELVGYLRRAVLETQALGKLPAPEITKALAPHMLGRYLEVPGVFFDLSRWGWTGGPARAGGLEVTPFDLPHEQAKIESLEMMATLRDDRIDYEVYYPSDVFGAELVERFARFFEAFAEVALARPERPLAELLGAAADGAPG